MSAGRRGNGEGTILQRADGRWAAAIILEDYRRKWIYGKTRRDVSDRLRRIRNDVAEGRPVINERLTVAEYLNRWLYDVAKQRTRPMKNRAKRRGFPIRTTNIRSRPKPVRKRAAKAMPNCLRRGVAFYIVHPHAHVRIEG